MSFGITQTSVTHSELALFSDCSEEIADQGDDSMQSDLQGELKAGTKSYTLTSKQNNPLAKEVLHYVRSSHLQQSYTGPKQSLSEKSHSVFSLSAACGQLPKRAEGREKLHQEVKKSPLEENPTQGHSRMLIKEESGAASKLLHPSHSHAVKLPSHLQAKESVTAKQTTQHLNQSENKQRSEPKPLSERHITKEESEQWWESRYHQKERQGDQGRQQQDQQHEENEKKMRISKSADISAHHSTNSYRQNERNQGKSRKPQLEAPKIGVYALYYILTKMGIYSDGVSNFNYKKEVELFDYETTEVHKKRLEEVKEAIKKEKETERWGIATKMFSWLASLFSIIAGIALIATGVGAIAGAMLVAGGIIQVSSQIMEMTGGWQKIAALLPGEDSEKKRAVTSWMQIGIAVFCLILSGAGVVWGGYASFGKAMNLAMAVLGGIAGLGNGVTTIGEGITNSFHKSHLSDVKKFDVQLARLKHHRKDIMEKMESGIGRLEQLFEDLARALEFEEELFQADQMIQHR